MLSFARKKEIEKTSFPLWLISFAISKFKETDFISYEDYISEIMNEIEQPVKKNLPTPEEIVSELSKIADLNRMESEKDG